MPEYQCSPIWEVGRGPSRNIAVSDLPISPELRKDLESWDSRFQATYLPHDPQDSGFMDETQANAFLQEGQCLAERLRSELGGAVDVEYVRVAC